MIHFFERLDIFMKYKGLNDNKITLEAGISNGLIGKGRQRGALSQDSISKILYTYSELNANWLLTGELPMLKGGDTYNNTPEQEVKVLGIPLILINAVAGFSEDADGIRYEDCEHYIVPEFERSGAEFLIRVSGSSMYPKYSSGDILACKKIKDIVFFQWGKVYVIDSSQGQMVKRIFEHENPDIILLVSDNKEKYPPFPIPRNEIRSLSIVLGVIRME